MPIDIYGIKRCGYKHNFSMSSTVRTCSFTM